MKQTIGQPAPDFSLTDLEGHAVSLEDFQDTPLLLNFYDTTCPWCQVELPRLAEVYRRMHNVDLPVLGIVVGADTAESAARFAEEKQLDFPQLLDTDGTLRAAFQLERVPSLALVNAEGVITHVYQGATEQLAGIIEQTILAAARGDEVPDYHLVGNGCGPQDN